MRLSSIDMGMMAALALIGAGCSSDFAEFDGGSSPAATDGADGAASGTSGDSQDPEGSGGLDDTSGGTSGEDTGLPPAPEACSDQVDCGEGGHCEADGDDEPTCVCDPGYATHGLRCLPCTPTTGLFDVDIPTASISATFLLRDQPFPVSFYEHGTIRLRDPISGDEVMLGDTRDGGTNGAVSVIPGNYEIHYVRVAGSDQVPGNDDAKVGMIHLEDGAAWSMEINIPAVELSGNLLIGGATPPGGLYENGTIVLRDPVRGGEVVLGDTRYGDFEVMVIPGTYDVHYRRKAAQDKAPINGNVRIGTVDVQDYDGDGRQSADIDVPLTTLSGTLTLDDATPPTGLSENGRIVLRDVVTSDEVTLGQTRDGSYDAPVVPGTYDVLYRRLVGGDLVPVNSAAVLMQTTLTPGQHTLDINIPTAVVTGVITVGGAPPPADPTDDGLVLLRNAQTGDEAVLGNTANGNYTRRVVLGAYDVHYRQETSSGGVPANTNAKLETIDIMGGAAFNVNIPMGTVSASVTVGGALPPESVYDDGLLYLIDPQTGDTVLLGNTRLASLQRPVVPGTYDLVYVVEAAGPTMPINAKSLLETVEVTNATNLAVDIPVAVMQGAITLAGATPPATVYDRASLLLHDVTTEDVIDLGRIDYGSFARTVTAGTYVLTYQVLSTTGMVPANTNAGLACVELQAP